MSRKRVKYSDTFKIEAVKMVVTGRWPIAQVAVELDVNPHARCVGEQVP
ncbi:MAG: transposase [Candidatus Microthrix sp.]|nr:transposase [Candidatus Microthrix sp.]